MTARYSALALLAALLAGCGLKGPLYLPPPEPLPEAATEAESEDAATGTQTTERDDDG